MKLLRKSLVCVVLLLCASVSHAVTLDVDFEAPTYGSPGTSVAGTDSWVACAGTFSNDIIIGSETSNQFAHTGNKGAGHIVKTLGEVVTDNITMSFDLRSNDFAIGASGGTPAFVGLGNSSTATSRFQDMAAVIGWRNLGSGLQFAAFNYGVFWQAQSYTTTSGWDSFKIVADVANKEYSVYVDPEQDGTYSLMVFENPSDTSQTATTLRFFSAYVSGAAVTGARIYAGDSTNTVDVDNIVIPEPASLIMLSIGGLFLKKRLAS